MGELYDLQWQLKNETWPTLDRAVRHGLLGGVLDAIEGHTEADPAALAVDFLVSFGNIIGRSPHRIIDSARHGTNLSALIVGTTSDGRKGTASNTVRRVFSHVDETWATESIRSGFSSGEGVIADLEKRTDQRLLIKEVEFAAVLARIAREGQTLSPLMRELFDGDPVSLRKVDSVLVVNDHLVSVIGHIVPHELRKRLTSTEQANGFANRFLFAMSRSANELPDGGDLTDDIVTPLAAEVAAAVDVARDIGKMGRNREAASLWDSIYRSSKAEHRKHFGLVGDLTGRWDVIQARLQMIYACLDGADVIGPEHVNAAAALWGYSEASVRYVFADSSGDTPGERWYAAICDAGAGGLNRTEQSNVFNRNLPADKLAAIRQPYLTSGRVVTQTDLTKGRPVTYEVAAENAAEVKLQS